MLDAADDAASRVRAAAYVLPGGSPDAPDCGFESRLHFAELDPFHSLTLVAAVPRVLSTMVGSVRGLSQGRALGRAGRVTIHSSTSPASQPTVFAVSTRLVGNCP